VDLAALYKVIYDRAVADTGSGGLFNSGTPLITGIFNNSVASSAVLPYIVYNVAADTAMHAFTRDIFRYQFRLQVYVARNTADPFLVGSNIIKRAFGDSSGGSAPSYGFHRWTPSLAGSWVSTTVLSLGEHQEHTDDCFCWVQDYWSLVSK
jgi:hypothetical protein